MNYAMRQTRKELGYVIHRQYSDMECKYIKNVIRSRANRTDRLQEAGVTKKAQARQKAYLDKLYLGCPSKDQLVDYQKSLKRFGCNEQDMIFLGHDLDNESRFLFDGGV
jgi:hypothetical protein